ncbi:MAG TPA: class I SAM-dependent RNA methyltransferase [Pyrinomonadaceae bacterium]|nr:class I SAM-dependent RNA methyltransferase [Pyrinomonadaceae bacterium]
MTRRRHTRGDRRGRDSAGPRGGDFELEVEVERILPGGLGLAHAEGKTVLVALAAPGDRLRVRVREKRGGVLFASVVEVLRPSPARVEPLCPYFGRCGGCDFQQLTYEAQLAAKVEIIRDCLRRIARIEPPADIPVTPSPRQWRYRSRAQWQHDRERELLGYFERGTHRVCDVVDCPVLAPELQNVLDELRAETPARLRLDDAPEFHAAAGDDHTTSLAPSLREDAPRELVRTVAGERYRFDAATFFQINHDLLEPLLREALRDAHVESTREGDASREAGSSTGDSLAVDLYCGVGLFTLPLARRFGRVVGVEGHPAACEFARRNLLEAGLSNAAAETSGVADWLARHASALAPADFLLLDPPRTGAEPGAVEGILRLRPGRIAYVSCDPATLARDLRPLVAADYRLDSLAAFDLFPQTHHVETVARLSREIS